jgi:hypothetical protein
MNLRLAAAYLLFLLPMKKLSAQMRQPDIRFEIFAAGYAVTPKSWVGRKDDTVYCIAILLKNNSHQVVKFGHLTCGWTGMFLPVNNDLDYVLYARDHNFPAVTALKPGQSCTNYAFVQKVNRSAHSIQLIFTYFEGNSYRKYQQNDNFGDTEAEPVADCNYYSNICELNRYTRIDFFRHLELMGPGENSYLYISRQNKKTIPDRDGFLKLF